MPNHHRLASSASLLLLSALSACGTIRPGHVPTTVSDGMVITAEHIRRSGAKDAWHALRISGTHLLIRENAWSDETRTSNRGMGSLILSNQVLVVVDGTHLNGWTFLREVPANTIEFIEILSGPAGTLRYGTPGGNGVIVVKTRTPTT